MPMVNFGVILAMQKNKSTHPHPGIWGKTSRNDYWCLTALIAMVGLVLGSVLPLSALRLGSLEYSSTVIGIVIAVYAVGLIISTPLCEPAVNRWGYRKTIQIFGLLSVIGCFLLQTSNTALALGVGLLFFGIALGVVFNLVETWVNELLPEAQRGHWLAIHCTVFTLFQLIGPLLVQILPKDYEFKICSLILLLAWPACKRLNEYSSMAKTDEEDKTSWWKYLVSAPAIACSTALFALFDAVILSLLPVYGLAAGLSEAKALLSVSVVLAGDTLLEWVIGFLADKFGRPIVHWSCAVVLLLSAPLLPLTLGTVLWWPLFFVIGGSAGGIYVMGMMASGQRFSGRRLLRMTALLGAVWGVGSIVGPVMTGVLMDFNAQWSLPAVILVTTSVLLLSLGWEAYQSNQASGDLASV